MFSALFELLTGNFLFFALHFDSRSVFPKPLSAKEERECFERMAQGDKAAKDKLIEHNLRLVAHIIKKYYSNSTDQEDLISIGTIGLIKAVSTFGGVAVRFHFFKCLSYGAVFINISHCFFWF